MTHSIKIEWTGSALASDAEEKKGIEAAIAVLNLGGSDEDASCALFRAMTDNWKSVNGVEFCTIIDGRVIA